MGWILWAGGWSSLHSSLWLTISCVSLSWVICWSFYWILSNCVWSCVTIVPNLTQLIHKDVSATDWISAPSETGVSRYWESVHACPFFYGDECFSRLVLQCASSRLLTEFTVLAAITDSGREFHSLTILCEKANFRRFSWNFSILSFAKWPRVDLFCLVWRSDRDAWQSYPAVRCIILKTSIISPLSLLNDNVGRSSLRSLSSYDWFSEFFSSLVARFCTFSTIVASFTRRGLHKDDPYSRCGLTNEQKSSFSVSSSRKRNVLLMIPSVLFAFFFFTAMCTSNFRLLSNVIPKSFFSVTMFVDGASGSFPSEYRMHCALLFPTRFTFALSGWNGRCHCLLLSTIALKSSCSLSSSPGKSALP